MTKRDNQARRKAERKAQPVLQLTTDDAVRVNDQARDDDQADGRTLEIRLFRYGEVAQTLQGPETFARGVFAGQDPAQVVIESQRHDGAIVGRGVQLRDDDVGPVLVARVSDTADGRDLLTLIRDGVLRAASVVFRPTPAGSRHRPDGVIERTRAQLRRVAILQSGAYPSAAVLAARSEDTDMTEDNTGTPEATEAPQAPAVDLAPIYQRFDAMDEAISRVAAGAAVPGAVEPSTLSRFDSYGDAWLAATTDPAVKAELSRVLADQTTGDNPGLVPPAWITRVAGLVNLGRRGVSGFGGPQPLPSAGMTINWPRVDDTTRALADSAVVAKQTAEKAELVSAAVSFDNGQSAISTYGGVSDVSWQLLRRSDPSYREQYLRFVTARWARTTNLAFWTAVVNDAGIDTDTLSLSADAAGAAALLGVLFDKSTMIESVAGQPADLVFAASDVFTRLGAMLPYIVPAPYGSQNVAGIATASSLVVNVSGLRVIHEPQMTAGHLIIASSIAAKWHEDGSPYVAEESDVAKLGTNIAVWSMGAAAVYEPAAISDITVTLA